MKEFSCGEVVPGCTAKLSGATVDEVLAAVAVHAQNDHGMAEVPPAVLTQVKSLIREV